ncbi:MAG: hypothetical protein ABEJ60_02815 [Halodesulfurarchaeum sp.]
MDYALDIDGAPAEIPAGTAILLEHPSIGGTDPVDNGFLRPGEEPALVVSTRTTAREVTEKLNHYGVDPDRTEILDTLSIDRGYSRRSRPGVHFVSAPDDIEGILDVVETFLADHDGGRVSFDSISELAYYAGEEPAAQALESVTELLSEHGAVGLFHVSPEVHEAPTRERFANACEALIEIDAEGSMRVEF